MWRQYRHTGLNFKILIKQSYSLIKRSYSPQTAVLSSRKELDLTLFYSQCQWFIVHPLESILRYGCHTQVITELPLRGKKKVICQWYRNEMERLTAGLGWVFTYKIKWASDEKICVRSGNSLIPVLQMLLEKSMIYRGKGYQAKMQGEVNPAGMSLTMH